MLRGPSAPPVPRQPMLRIIDRYLLRELAVTFLVVIAVAMLIAVGGSLVIGLGRVARGLFPPTLLVSQIGLRSLEALSYVLPLALFMATLLSYGRLYRDAEMPVLAGSGVSVGRLLRPLFLLALPVMAALAANVFWLSPAALRTADRMVEAANRSLLVAGLDAGEFKDLPGRNGVIFVGEISDDGSKFGRVFVHDVNKGNEDIITAARGELYFDHPGGARFLRLTDGYRVEGEPGKSNYRVLKFSRNDIELPEPEAADDKRPQKRMTTTELAGSSKPPDRAELHWRLAFPVSALLLSLLAVPLVRAPPREPRWGALLIAVLVYGVYFSALSVGRGLLADGKLSATVGLWVLHLPLLVIAVGWLARQGAFVRGPAPAPRGGA